MGECLIPYDCKEDADIFETSPPGENMCNHCGEESDNPLKGTEVTSTCKACKSTRKRIARGLQHDKQLLFYWRLSPNKRSITASAKHAYKDELLQIVVPRLYDEAIGAGLIANGAGTSNGKKKPVSLTARAIPVMNQPSIINASGCRNGLLPSMMRSNTYLRVRLGQPECRGRNGR